MADEIEKAQPMMPAPDASTPHRSFWKLKGVGPDGRTPVYEEVQVQVEEERAESLGDA